MRSGPVFHQHERSLAEERWDRLREPPFSDPFCGMK